MVEELVDLVVGVKVSMARLGEVIFVGRAVDKIKYKLRETRFLSAQSANRVI